MNSPLANLHDLLEKHCLKNEFVGFAINIDWLKTKFKEQISFQSFKIAIPTQYQNISVSLLLKPENVEFSESGGEILLTKFIPTISILSTALDILNVISIEFETTQIELTYNNAKKLKFKIVSHPNFTTKSGHPDQEALEANGISMDEYFLLELAILSDKIILELLNSFVNSIPFPSLQKAMKVFEISLPFDYNYENGYVLIKGKPTIKNVCNNVISIDLFEEEIKTSVTSKQLEEDNISTIITLDCTRKFKEIDLNKSEFSIQSEVPIGVFLPKVSTFLSLGSSVFGPAIAGSDSDTSFFVDWYWSASARLLGGIQVDVVPAKNAITINAPIHVDGNAGAAIGAGCLKIPVPSSTLIGEANPNLLTLKVVGASNNSKEVLIVCNSHLKVDIKFYGPPLVDILINIFMDSLGENWLKFILQSKINEFNFKILDLSQLNAYKGKFGWLSKESFRNESIMIALTDNDG